MSRMKKFIALALAVSMMAAIAACGNGSNGNSSSSSSESQQQSSQPASQSSAESQPASSEAEAEDDLGVWAPMPELTTITTAMQENTVDVGFEEGEDYQNNIFYRRFEELLNVKVVNEWTVQSGTDYTQKLNMAIADNDLPDVFIVKNKTVLDQVINAGIAMDITDVFEENASDTIKGFMDDAPEVAKLAWKDDRMYAIPELSFGNITQHYALWIRKDWKEEQNLEAPETYEDLVNVLQVFKDNYGATLGLKADLSQVRWYGLMFDAYPVQWIRDEDGQVVYGGTQPEMKDLLAALNDLYNKGLIDKSWVETDGTTFQDNVTQDKYGVFTERGWINTWFEGVLKEKGYASGNYCEAYPMPSPEDHPYRFCFNLTNEGYIVINSQCEHPEAVIKCVNLFSQVQFVGDEGPYEMTDDVREDYLRTDQTVCWPLRVFDPNADYNQYKTFGPAIAAGTAPEKMGIGSVGKWENIQKFIADPDANISGILAYYQLGDPEHSAYAVADKVLSDPSRYFYNVLWETTPQAVTDLNSTCNPILVEGWTKIICGEEPLDYFDELVEQWKKAGGDEMTKAMNETYPAN